MKIGTLNLSNRIIIAPMAGITDLVFRQTARRFGCGLCLSEMISANGLVRKTDKTYQYLQSSPNDKPLGVQIFGSDPCILAEAAAIATDHGADLIDINMGCPVKKVIKSGAGAALMRNPAIIATIITHVRKATPLPLTIKIRSGVKKNEINAVTIARIAEDQGVDALSIHPRTMDQGFSGKSDWKHIREVKAALRIPVIGSGDIRAAEDAHRMFTETGCDGIMLGRGILGNPWLISEAIASLSGQQRLPVPTLEERKAIIHLHLEMTIKQYGATVGIRLFRKHLLWYTKGLPRSSSFRQDATTINTFQHLSNFIDRYFDSLQAQSDNTIHA